MKSKEEQIKDLFKSVYNTGNVNAEKPEDFIEDLYNNFNKWFLENKVYIELLFNCKELFTVYYSNEDIKNIISKIDFNKIVKYHTTSEWEWNSKINDEEEYHVDIDTDAVTKDIKKELIRILDKKKI